MTTLTSTQEYDARVRCLICLRLFDIKNRDDVYTVLDHLEECKDD